MWRAIVHFIKPLLTTFAVIAYIGFCLGALVYAQQFGPSSGGRSWSVNCLGDISADCSQVKGTHLTAVLPIAQGGTANTLGATSSWQGSSATIAHGATDYIGEGQNSATAVQGTEASVETIVPFAGTASNLYCAWVTAAQAGGVTFTVDKNGTPQTLTFQVTSGTTGHDTNAAHNFTFAAGDLLDISIANANASNATGIVTCAFQKNG